MQKNILEKYQPVIGLELHVQVNSESKIFCSCPSEFDAEPNTYVCPVCLGHPGTLPVLNKLPVELCIKTGLAMDCKINTKTAFARKNYFYPDLPKGYQITQYESPLCSDGYTEIYSKDIPLKKIRIKRIHLEEDAGKSIHDLSESETFLDFNRCGIPLIEIVTEPDLNSPEEVSLFLHKVKQTLEYLEVSDCNMEQGSLRCDVNISVKLKNGNTTGTKTEIKNLNSFKNINDAIDSEIKRQTGIIENGGKISFNTLNYDVKEKITVPLRSKEAENDYRYFSEPDLVYLNISDAQIEELKNSLPESSEEKILRFKKEYSLNDYESEILTGDKNIAEYFERTVNNIKIKNYASFKLAGNWIINEVLAILNEKNISIRNFKISPESLAKLLNPLIEEKISRTTAKEIFSSMPAEPGKFSDIEAIILEKDLLQVSDKTEIEEIIKKVLDENPNELLLLKSGKVKIMNFLTGEIMKKLKGKANPKIVTELFNKFIKK
ncbi:MAG: Asp-tRNA(Asn)/Glu-tRNA(Gln) amidotransferase subunit GatB [Ignavibacteria bacterium]|nr:Asp-tRNA(Asn)/Glu-tRNA(Gln) amidotransferase subunit GatB [Ignavibacteria bacterium]